MIRSDSNTAGGQVSRLRIVLWGVIYAVFFAVGTVGHYIEATNQLMLRITPLFLLLAGLSASLPLFLQSTPVLIWGALTFLGTFALEAIGVATGAIFGSYSYGETLGARVFEVPLIIGFNWVVVVLGAIIVSGEVTKRIDNKFLAGIAGAGIVGSIAVIFDLVLEPVAIFYDYWRWESETVPIRNYVAWFAIAAVASVPLQSRERVRVYEKKSAARRSVITLFVLLEWLFLLSLLPAAI